MSAAPEPSTPHTGIRLEAGSADDAELAAVAVALAALNAASHEEAHSRELAQRAGSPVNGWAAAYHRIPSAHSTRLVPSEQAWRFSHR